MDFWSWITATSAETYLTGAGALGLAALFATNRIITRGQHNDRIQDLKGHHERELAEIRTSRDGWKVIALSERERADAATSTLGNMADTLQDVEHVLVSLDRALPAHPEGSTSA